MTKDKSIFIKNVYYMLSYAFRALQKLDDEKLAKEEFDNIHNLFAAILALGIGRQLKQGLYREYLNRGEDLNVVRGKICMPGTIRNLISRKQRLTCEYDELSEDNALNQILKTTAMLLLRHPDVDGRYKDDLKKEMLYFSNVREIKPTSIKWQSLRFQRNNQSYQLLISICQLIIEGMLLTTDNGEYKLASFLDDQRMSRLYEKFILEYYVKEHPELKARSAKIPWALDDGMRTLLPDMKSDVTLENEVGDTVLIIDAKYYSRVLAENQYHARMVHSANLYQIFTYVKNKDKQMGEGEHAVSGMLLYARTDEYLQPNLSYQMSGNRISVQVLDLNREFSEIAEQLDKISEDHFGCKYTLRRD